MDPGSIKTRYQAALVGFLLGEVVGVPYDQVPRDELPPASRIGPIPPSAMDRGHPRAPRFAWADGGAQCLALLDSLGEKGTLDLEDFAARLVRWLHQGEYCVEGVVFEYGVQTSRALAAFRDGVPAAHAGPRGERHNGNGALMRVLPIALWFRGSDEDLVRIARESCLPSHGHPISQLCCALYCQWVRNAVTGQVDGWDEAIHTVTQCVRDSESDTAWLRLILGVEKAPHPNNRYVVNTLWATREAFLAGNNWLERVRAAVLIGDDTDTVAGLVGGVSAAREGVAAIPADWLDHLPEHAALLRGITILASAKD